MRKTEFANSEYYHIYNRGVDKRETFSDAKDYNRFILAMDLLNDEQEGLMIEWRDYQKSNKGAKLSNFLKLSFRKRDPLVEIIVYCLNPNHYHFILKQIAEKGIEKFMHKLGTSYTKYFNTRKKRSGALFQGRFKSIHIDSNEYLLYLSAYVNKNNTIHGYSKNDNWPYSSLPGYLGRRWDGLIRTSVILKQFNNINEYKEFLKSNVLYMKEKKELEKYLLEE